MENIKNKGKQVVIASTLLNFLTGMMYAWSLISKVLVENFNWTSKEASIPYTIHTITFTIAMVAFGKIQDTKGPKFLAAVGAVFVGLGFILSGFIIKPIVLMITIGILTGMGIGIITVSTTPPAIKWYPENMKGKITGIVVAGVGLSSIFFSPVVNMSLGSLGLLKTFRYLGALIFISTLFVAQFLENPPEGYRPIKVSENYGVNLKERDFTWQEMLKDLDFYKLWLMLGFNSAAGLMIISHIANIVKIQVGWEGGFLLVMLISTFNTLGRLLGGSLSDKIGRINLMRGIFTIQGANMLLFSTYSNLPAIIIGVSIAGFCYGAAFSVFPATIGDYYGTKNFGINYGLMFTGWTLGGVIGPMTAATIFDISNTYKLAYIIALCLLIMAFLITFTIKKRED